MEEFLKELYGICLAESELKPSTKSITLVMNKADRMFSSGEFGEWDDILKAVDLDKISTPVIVSFLVCNCWAKNKLKERCSFIDKAMSILKVRINDEERLKNITVNLIGDE